MNTFSNRRHRYSTQRGVAILEALIAFLVMAAGILALVSFYGTNQKNNADAKVQSEALARAEEQLQLLESYLGTGDSRLNDTTCNGTTETVSGELSDFTRCWTIATDGSNPSSKTVTVTVNWEDRDGIDQNVVLSTQVFFRDPTEEVEHFLAVVHDADEIRSGGTPWDDTSTGTDTSTDTGTDTTTDTSTDTSTDTGTNTDTQHTLIPIEISGRLSGSNAADLTLLDVEFSDAQIDGQQLLFATCVIDADDKGFSCDALYFSVIDGWTGTIALNTNKVFCSVGTNLATVSGVRTNQVVLSYTSLSQSDNGIPIVVANNAGQCP